MKIASDFHCKWKPSCAYHKLTLFIVSKDEWHTKEGTDKSVKNALYVQQYGKWHLMDWSDVKQWKYQSYSFSHCQITLEIMLNNF